MQQPLKSITADLQTQVTGRREESPKFYEMNMMPNWVCR